MQKLSAKFKNVPTNAQQVCSSTNSQLNRDQSLSVESKVLTDNNLEVDQVQHTGRSLKAIVYVINKQGQPLMPCSYAKSKRMVKKGAARVVKCSPFTIQLNFDCENKTQEITLGIDSGYSHIGFSAVTDKKEVITGELKLDNKTKDRLTERKMYRRGRRNKLWYRKPRFNNRKIEKGWLPPSIQRKYDTHLNLINKIKKILPITNIIVEVGDFDIQKLDNPEIQGKEYQEGNLAGYLNIKSYLIAREKGKCQLCGEEKGKDCWAIHHIKQRKDGGSDKESNLALLHKKCHEKLHENNEKIAVSNNKSYKQSTFMNIVKNKFQQDLNCGITYGYLTYTKRFENNLEKSHINDAFCIADGKNQERIKQFEIIQKHRNNRVLQMNRKGFKPSIKRQRYKIQIGDLFWVEKKKYVSNGMFCNGKYICYGITKKKEYFNIKLVNKYFNQGSLIWKQIM